MRQMQYNSISLRAGHPRQRTNWKGRRELATVHHSCPASADRFHLCLRLHSLRCRHAEGAGEIFNRAGTHSTERDRHRASDCARPSPRRRFSETGLRPLPAGERLAYRDDLDPVSSGGVSAPSEMQPGLPPASLALSELVQAPNSRCLNAW